MSKLFKSFLPKRDNTGGSPTAPVSDSNSTASPANALTSQDISLTLTHLRKVFYDYQHPKIQWTQQDKNDRLYSTLPMVVKVLRVLLNNEWEERFPELSEYTLTLSKLLVAEIRLRADKEPNSSAASQAIIDYLQMNDETSSISGWSLLHALKLLSTGPNSLMDKFAQASLPSTLVKCLYLFFDLPEISKSSQSHSSHQDSITPKEKRILLQQVFFQLLSRIAMSTSCVEELTRRDDLLLLFNAISSNCPEYNRSWRTQASDMLLVISKHTLASAISCMHNARCISQCAENLRRATCNLSLTEILAVYETLICLLIESASISSSLLDDFRLAHCYVHMKDIILRLENDWIDTESEKLFARFIPLLGDLTYAGFNELKLATRPETIIDIPNFIMPQPKKTGFIVRNPSAFTILQSIFQQSSHPVLINIVFDTINSVILADNANYFLCGENLSPLTEVLYNKGQDVQTKIYDLLEFIVFQLRYIPHRELVNLSIMLKSNGSVQNHKNCVKYLIHILKFNSVIKDALRELGFIEVLIARLHQFATLLKETVQDPNDVADHLDQGEKELGFMVMEALALLLSHNQKNAKIFREHGGARLAHNIIPYRICRIAALTVVLHLVLCTGGEDDTGTLLGLIHTARLEELEMKSVILKGFLYILRESHRTRTVFRKVGGFVYIVSLLISMEGCLAVPPKHPWLTVPRHEILSIIRLILNTLTVAMRFEPGNVRLFENEVRWQSLCDAIRLLGCFNNETRLTPSNTTSKFDYASKHNYELFEQLFYSLDERNLTGTDLPLELINACHIARCFHDIALDCIDSSLNSNDDFTTDKIPESLVNPMMRNTFSTPENADESSTASNSPLFRTGTFTMPTVGRVSSTTFAFPLYSDEPLIVYPGAIVCFLQLIASIPRLEEEQYSNRLQYFLMLTLKNLLKYDRNLQIMATYGFSQHILQICQVALENENHHLHTSVEYIFERLAAFILPVRTLRQFLRMGMESMVDPTSMLSIPRENLPNPTNKIFLPLNRIKCLVSMTTLRDIRREVPSATPNLSSTGLAINPSSITSPAYVEFNMGIEGFGALLLPCLSPQSISTPTNVVGNFGMVTMSNDVVLQGGMTLTNGGERPFPPQYGMTYSTWFYVEKFGPIKENVHPIRLLSIIRHTFTREDYRFILQLYLHPREKSLIVSTQEHPFQDCHNDSISPDELKSDGIAKFICSEIMTEQRWTHVALVWTKGMLKNSSVVLYINGKQIAVQKLHYIGNMTVPPGSSVSTFAYIGSLPIQRVHSIVQWRQGPCFLIEDILSSQIISAVYGAGPNYIGSFQAVCIDPSNDVFSPLFPEERIIFGLHPASFFETTLSHFKKLYNKNDAKLIAKQLNMPTSESTVPIRILYNIAAPYAGPARTVGGVVIGYLGVRIFIPNPVSKTIEYIGGPHVMLGLVAMSNDIEAFYASVKAFVCILKSNKQMHNELLRTRAYQSLGFLFLKKRHLINSHILHLTCTLVGTIDTIRESTAITNPAAFEHLLCEFEIWKGATVDIQKSLFDHLLDVFLTSDTQNLLMNQRLSQKINLMARLLHLLKDGALHESTRLIVVSLIRVLLVTYKNTNDIVKLGQFLVYLLPSSSISEKNVVIQGVLDDSSVGIQNISLRNYLLEMLAKTISEEKRSQTNLTDEFLTHLGYDWLLLFLQSHLHPRTIVLSMKLLLAFLLSSTNALTRFRDNAMLLNTSSATNFTPNSVTSPTSGSSVAATPMSPLATTINDSWMNVFNDRSTNKPAFGLGIDPTIGLGNNANVSIPLPGFVLLQYLLAQRAEIVPVYYQLVAFLFRQLPSDEVMEHTELNVEKLLKSISLHAPLAPTLSSSNSSGPKQQYEFDICPILLSMIRNLTTQNQELSEQYGLAIIKFFHQLYRRKTEFFTYAQSVEYLSFLCGIVFPPVVLPQTSFDSPSTITRQKAVSMEEPSSPSLEILISTFTTSNTLRGTVVDTVRDIIIDSFYANTTRIPNVIDFFLSALPENMNADRTYQMFIQCIFKSIIDHLESSDLCAFTSSDDHTTALNFGMGDTANANQATRTSYSRTFSSMISSTAATVASAASLNMSSYKLLLENVTHFIERMVDKIWDIDYREPKQIFEFVIKIINQAKKRGANAFMESLYRSLNRTILFELSRKMESIGDQMVTLDALHRLANNRQLIFNDANQDAEFFGCLCYCLIILTDETGMRQANDDPNSRSIWYQRLDSPTSGVQPNKSLIINAAQRIWSELYMKKKPALEEVLKMNFSQLVTQNKTTLVDVSESLYEPASRVWTRFIEGELRITDKIQQQIMHVGSRLQRLTGGVTGGFRSSLHQLRGTKVKREQVKLDRQTIHGALALMSVTVSNVKENVDNEYRRYAQNCEQKFNALFDEWLATERDLLRERGLWGFEQPDPLAKYKLDFIEGPCRMRKRMVLNEDFYKHYPYRLPIENTKRKFNPPASFDSKEYHDRQSYIADRLLIVNPTTSTDTPVPLSPPPLISKESVDVPTALIAKESQEAIASPTETTMREEGENWSNENDNELVAPTLLSVRRKAVENDPENPTATGDEDEEDPMAANLEQDEAEAETEAQQTPSTSNETMEMSQTNQNVLRLLEEDEKITLAFRCARIEGLDGSEGIFIFGREHFYILEGYTYNAEKNEIVDLDKCRNEYVPLIPKSSTMSGNDLVQYRKECSKFAYEDIKEVHKRRHILQPIALELFAADGRNYLLVFVRKERNKVYQRLLSSATELTDSAIHSVSGQRRSINVEQGSLRNRRKITSFIGTLMGERSVTQRWERGEISNFQYLMYLNTLAGRSYNDLMQYPVFPWILADYDSKELNLTNPATFRDLSKPMGAQTSNRLVQFQKRFAEWDDPTGSTPAYHYGTHYSSAMIVASYLVRTEPFTQVFLRLQGGHFDLADRMFHSIKDSWFSASRNNMADVKELIPEFFYLPDFLLNTNKFDLGKKQNGLALNDVILPSWSKNDPREFIRIHRMALESDYVSAHLNEWIDLIFGYKQSGPAAVEATNVFHHLFYEGAVNVDDISDPLERSAIIGFINNFGQIPKQLFKRPHPQKKLSRSLMDSIGIERNLFFNHVNSLRPSKMPIKELKTAVGLILPTEKSLIALEQCKAIIPPNYTRCIQYGFPDESLRIMSVDSDKSLMIYELVQDGKITNVLCPTSQYVITAGTNTLINVWEMGKGRHKRLHLKTRLTGHNDTITCLTASQAYRILISGSDDQTCIIWDLNRLHFIRQLPNHAGPVSCVTVNELTGDIASASGSYLYVWTINGQLLASINTMSYSRQQSILCVAMSQMNEWDDENVIITGSSDGVVRMWTIGYDQVPEAPPSSPSLATLGEDRSRVPSISQPSAIKLTSNNGRMSVDSDAESDEGEGKSSDNNNQPRLSVAMDQSFDEETATANSNTNRETQNALPVPTLNSPTGSDKFIVVTDSEIQEAKSSTHSETLAKTSYLDLKEGFKWDRRLNYRGKLTMHTAYERKENPSPAAVTAIGISKDHKMLFVGDSRGRIFSWIVSDNPGRTNADHWMKDDAAGACKDCSIRFTFAERRHHCRNCGQLFCARCSRFETDIPKMKIYKNVRVCRSCYASIKEQRSTAAATATTITSPTTSN